MSSLTKPSRVLKLPYPPSMNGYWRTRIAGRPPKQFVQTYISKEGQEYTEQLAGLISTPTILCKVRVTIWVWMPDRRKRDIDNLLKPMLDACTKAGLWQDDSQIHDLRIVRRGVTKGGKLLMRIQDLEQMLF